MMKINKLWLYYTLLALCLSACSISKNVPEGYFLLKSNRIEYVQKVNFAYDLEDILSLNDIPIQPVEIYETLPQPSIIKGYFDGLIFFSPSGVQGYAILNGFEDTHCFCLGSTTAEAVREFTPKLSIAKTPSESQLFLSITKHFNQ